MISTVFFNLCSLFFPISCYFLYLVYSKVVYKAEKKIFFSLSLLTSFYLCVKSSALPIHLSFLVNIPLLFSLIKDKKIASLILSVATSYYFVTIYDANLLIFLSSYLLIFLICSFTDFNKLNTFVIIKVLAGVLSSVLYPSKFLHLKIIIPMISTYLLMYITFYLLILFYKKIEMVVKMHESLQELTKEKNLYSSLFKITHEIKNPLAVCKGYLDMFDASDIKKSKKYASIINQEIDRTLIILNDFSNISKLSINAQNMDINMLLEDVCDETNLILKDDIKFSYNILDQDIYMNGDYNRLKQVFINVIKNAKEAIEKDGKVTLDEKLTKDKVIITIEDNGCGMDREVSKKMGTPFYTTKQNGTGLGVCLSKEIISKHKGNIKYVSKKENGTKVIITLPIIKASI